MMLLLLLCYTVYCKKTETNATVLLQVVYV